MKKSLPVNRAVALGGTAAAVAAAVVSVLGAVDSTSKAIVVSVALLVVGAVVCVFLLGSQKHEARQPTQATFTASSGAPYTVTHSTGGTFAQAAPPAEPDAIDLGPDT